MGLDSAGRLREEGGRAAAGDKGSGLQPAGSRCRREAGEEGRLVVAFSSPSQVLRTELQFSRFPVVAPVSRSG